MEQSYIGEVQKKQKKNNFPPQSSSTEDIGVGNNQNEVDLLLFVIFGLFVTSYEVMVEILPAFPIILIDVVVLCKVGEVEHVTRFEHERHGVGELLRGEIHGRGLLEDGSFRTVSAHAGVQRGAAGYETGLFGVVNALDEAHVLGHAVAVEPRRTEGLFLDQPARREDDEICDCSAVHCAGTREHCKDGRVGVVVRDGADRAEAIQVVFVGIIVSVPGDDVVWRMVLLKLEELTQKLVHNDPILFYVLI